MRVVCCERSKTVRNGKYGGSEILNAGLAVVVVPDRQRLDACWFARFGGLAFIERQVRLVRLSGVEKVALWCPDRLSEQMCQQFSGDDCVVVETNETAVGNTVLVVQAEDVFEAEFFRSLQSESLDNGSGVCRITTGGSGRGVWLMGGLVASKILAMLRKGETVGPVEEYTRNEHMLVGTVGEPADLRELEEVLWTRCRKPVDGYVSRWFNRAVSLFISRRLVNFSVTPNQVTLFAIVPGLAGAFLAAQGGYWSVLAGAALLQVNSIIDGVDGELARMKVQSSFLGEWLDTLSDVLVNVSFLVALGIGAVAAGADLGWLWLALFTGLTMVIYSAIYAFWLWRAKKGAVLSTAWFEPTKRSRPFFSVGGQIDFWVRFGTQVFRRDTMIAVILLAALCGVAKYVLFAFAFSNLTIIAGQISRSVYFGWFAQQSGAQR